MIFRVTKQIHQGVGRPTIRHKSLRGFTIVELLVVIVVIAILAAITIVTYNGIQGRAKAAAALSAANAFYTAISMYRADNGVYPGTANTNVCLGENYPASGAFSANSCSTSTPVLTDPTLIAQLKTELTNLPDVSSNAARAVPTSRGMVYYRSVSAGGEVAWIQYQLDGDQNCGQGTKSTFTNPGGLVTLCTFYPK